MKKILFFLLLSVFGFGQNPEKLCNLNFDEAKAIANDIGLMTNSRVMDIADREQFNKTLFEIVPNAFSDSDYAKYKNGEINCEGCFKVHFSYIMKGENKDLEIKGVKTYKFDEYTAKFLNVLPFWQKYFRPDVNQENYNTFDNREFRINHQLYAMLYDKRNGIWNLKMFRCQ